MLNLWEQARLFALVNFAMADGFITGFDTRYFYNSWRPVTAIRDGDADGNDETVGDPLWESFLNTPPIPDYPSTHSVLGAAAATVLAHFFGADDIAFTRRAGRRSQASPVRSPASRKRRRRTATRVFMRASISASRAGMA